MKISWIYTRTLFLTLPLSLILGCKSTTQEPVIPYHSTYCDNFLVYDMCARDLDSDGVVEVVYFADTKHVFLFEDGISVPRDLEFHKCAQIMDDSLIESASRLLYINDDTPMLQRADIKATLMFSYMDYMPRVNRCNRQHKQDSDPEPIDDEFTLDF